MKHLISRLLVAVLAAAPSLSVAQVNRPPRPSPVPNDIPAARDIPYAGTIRLDVDATDARRGIFTVKEVIPVKSGHLVLLYPEWEPGAHAPMGRIGQLAGLTISAGPRQLPWRRDTVDVYAFHVDVPPGVDKIQVEFLDLSATAPSSGGIQMTPGVLNIDWSAVVLYPAGYFVHRINVAASVVYPGGWTSATALSPTAATTPEVTYAPVGLDTLIDSPVVAGRYAKVEQLSPDTTMDIVAERPSQIALSAEKFAVPRRIVEQARKLFGVEHYDHYWFLISVSDLPGRVEEHHRSAEYRFAENYFAQDFAKSYDFAMLAHEYVHSWNGKYLRGEDLWTPDYRTPMRGSLLWVYEGLTELWGLVLTARADPAHRDYALGELGWMAALESEEPGRRWRTLMDTITNPARGHPRPQAWTTYQRDRGTYYYESALIWLEADQIIRERSNGARSLDDFARVFFGGRDHDWSEHTYSRQNVVDALNTVLPFDWAKFFHDRVDIVAPAPLGGIERGGYRLVYTDTPDRYWMDSESEGLEKDLRYSLGVKVGSKGVINDVMWDGPAFKAGLTVGTVIEAVNGASYHDGALEEAVTAAKGRSDGIRLSVKAFGETREAVVQWSGGLRYPHLQRDNTSSSTLDALLATRR